MSIELQVLGWAAILAVVQLVLYAIAVNLELGTGYTSGPRDGPAPVLSPLSGRLQRALNNHLEWLLLFAIAVMLVEMGDARSAQTAWAAKIYLAARVAYVPAYVLNISYLRSGIWGVGFIATVVMLLITLI